MNVYFAFSILILTSVAKVIAYVPIYRPSVQCSATALHSTISQETLLTNKVNYVAQADVPYGSMIDTTGIAFSGLKGKALSIRADDIPSFAEVKSVIPEECFKVDDMVSFAHLAMSSAATALCTIIGLQLVNLIGTSSILTFPIWTAYAALTGTVAMGLWVLAHECGHGAFSNNKKVNDFVGFVLHSALLVPFFSWKHSHAVHHRYTNDMERGETHVPEEKARGEKAKVDSSEVRSFLVNQFGNETGLNIWGGLQGFLHLVLGWPAYLLFGATGGPARGLTNHFYPEPLFNSKDQNNGVEELFPGKWKLRVYQSDIGVAFVVGSLLAWGLANGFDQVMALYGGPLLVVNLWLVLYTW